MTLSTPDPERPGHARFGATAVVFVPWSPFPGAGERFVDTVASLRRSEPLLDIVVAAPVGGGLEAFEPFGASVATAGSLAQAVDKASRGGTSHVLAVADGVAFPAGLLSRALAAVEEDVRIASVSFWSNAAGIGSFPHVGHPVLQPPVGHDAATLTRALRTAAPPFRPVPVMYAVGAAVLLSASGLSAVGGLDEGPESADAAFADFGLRARSRGLLNMLDPSTYLTRSADVATVDVGRIPETDERWITARHRSFAPAFLLDATEADAPLRISHHRARTVVEGIRVLIDGSSLGPMETGTQVQTLALIRALAMRPQVREVSVSIPHTVPGYAWASLEHPKITVAPAALTDADAYGPIDVIHRPFQPDQPLDFRTLRRIETRIVVTIQDLIAYRTGSYHLSSEDWMRYREAIRSSLRHADAVVTISHDVTSAVIDEALPISPDRLYLVPNGTDHLVADAPEQYPAAFLTPELASQPFALVLGTTYAHKQRDLAIRAVQDVRSRGLSLMTVLAGAQVPLGSSRREEAKARQLDEGVLEIPDVTSSERTWLLRHAAVLLYPSAAEGFGLVPFEAARFGTPTAAADFGPLHEVIGTPPVASRDWMPGRLADAIEALLTDPVARERQIDHVNASGEDYTWATTAEKLVDVYARVLAQPLRAT